MKAVDDANAETRSETRSLRRFPEPYSHPVIPGVSFYLSPTSQGATAQPHELSTLATLVRCMEIVSYLSVYTDLCSQYHSLNRLFSVNSRMLESRY